MNKENKNNAGPTENKEVLKNNQVEKENTIVQEPKFRQEKTKKPKKKRVWITVSKLLIFTLIIGIIIGAIGLYMAQKELDYEFLIPKNILEKEIDIDQEKTKNEEENITEKTEKLLTVDEAYAKLDELYKIATEMYLQQPSSYFNVNTKSFSSENEYAVEILDYEKVLKQYYTENGISDYESYWKDGIIKESEKVYIPYVTGVQGMDNLGYEIIKIDISESEIKCIIKTTYNASFDKMVFAENSGSTFGTDELELKYIESDFVIKKVDNNWLIDSFKFQK